MADQHKIVTDRLNTFFTNNKIQIATSAPTSGSYIVGDIVIKSNQKAGTNVGWICTVAGAPGTWVEFGVGVDHTHNYAGSSSAGGAANSVKTNLAIKLNGGTTEGTDLFTFNGSTAKTINITPSSIGAATSASVGTLSSLQTSAKDNLVAAINEVFQSGNNVKQKLVDTLIANGITGISTSTSWDILISHVNTVMSKANYSYTVSSISGAPYGFTLGSDGFYVSQGKGVDYTIAMCRINIVNTSNLIAYVDYIDYHHNDHHALISKKDTAFNTTNIYGDDSDKILVDLERDNPTAYKVVNSVALGTGSGFFDIKFCRGSVIQYDDVFKFRIRFSTI